MVSFKLALLVALNVALVATMPNPSGSRPPPSGSLPPPSGSAPPPSGSLTGKPNF